MLPAPLAEVDPNRKKSSGPELAGALDSNPDIYVPEIAEIQVDTSDFVLPEPTWRLEKMEISATHEVRRELRQGSSASSCVCTPSLALKHTSVSLESPFAAASGLRLRTSRWCARPLKQRTSTSMSSPYV